MKTLIAVLSFVLCGCSVGHYEVDKTAMSHTKMAFVGIPTLLGIGTQGTTTPITSGLSLTNKHVAGPTMRTVVKSHRSCDVALIAQDNSAENVPVKFGEVKKGDEVQIFGYSSRTALPVSSKGSVIGFRMIKGCLVGYTNAGSVQGMSGGAVMNKAGDLVGIFFGFDSKRGVSYFVPYQEFKPILNREVYNG